MALAKVMQEEVGVRDCQAVITAFQLKMY